MIEAPIQPRLESIEYGIALRLIKREPFRIAQLCFLRAGNGGASGRLFIRQSAHIQPGALRSYVAQFSEESAPHLALKEEVPGTRVRQFGNCGPPRTCS